MSSRLADTLARLAATLRFVPGLIIAGLGLLAAALLWADTMALATELPLFTTGISADGQVNILGTLASSMLSVATVVFSLTFVALSTMTCQLGPRLLLWFTNDRLTQIVLGGFVGSFLYSLTVLIAVTTSDVVPVLSLLGAVVVAVLAVLVVVVFIHHMAPHGAQPAGRRHRRAPG